MDLHREWILHEAIDSEEEVLHRDATEEISFYSAVSSGDLEVVRQNCIQRKFMAKDGVGTLSRDPLTNIKYHFIVTTAMITRFCINSGMEMEQAYRLSDFYIQKLDFLHTMQAVSDLHDRMVLDFTGKMRLMRNNIGTSKAISDCIEYIYVHIKERVTVNDLAEHTGLSPSYLSHLFKNEVGTSVSDFIREKKIEKAQNLLKFSDYSSIEIANYLSFSSQSHFIQLFKKYVGMSPKKYHDLNKGSTWNSMPEENQGTPIPNGSTPPQFL